MNSRDLHPLQFWGFIPLWLRPQSPGAFSRSLPIFQSSPFHSAPLSSLLSRPWQLKFPENHLSISLGIPGNEGSSSQTALCPCSNQNIQRTNLKSVSQNKSWESTRGISHHPLFFFFWNFFLKSRRADGNESLLIPAGLIPHLVLSWEFSSVERGKLLVPRDFGFFVFSVCL